MNDLVIDEENGIAIEFDPDIIEYGQSYVDTYQRYEENEMSALINQARKKLVAEHYSGLILDVGVGSGTFVRSWSGVYGYDINPVMVKQLKDENLWADDFESFRAFTFWDVIEHIPDHRLYFERIKGYLFTSIPIIKNIEDVKQWKHYKPGEHLYYFTLAGFIHWMKNHHFSVLTVNTEETRIGREDIYSFAFFKD